MSGRTWVVPREDPGDHLSGLVGGHDLSVVMTSRPVSSRDSSLLSDVEDETDEWSDGRSKL